MTKFPSKTLRNQQGKKADRSNQGIGKKSYRGKAKEDEHYTNECKTWRKCGYHPRGLPACLTISTNGATSTGRVPVPLTSSPYSLPHSVISEFRSVAERTQMEEGGWNLTCSTSKSVGVFCPLCAVSNLLLDRKYGSWVPEHLNADDDGTFWWWNHRPINQTKPVYPIFSPFH